VLENKNDTPVKKDQSKKKRRLTMKPSRKISKKMMEFIEDDVKEITVKEDSVTSKSETTEPSEPEYFEFDETIPIMKRF